MSVDNVAARTRNPRVQRRDRPWMGATVSTLVGPCDMPSVNALERAVETLSQRFPHSRLGWGLDDPKRHWVVATGHGGGKPGAVVVERSRAGHTGLGETLDSMVSDSSVDAPLTLFRFEEHFGLRISHEYGDGRFYDEAVGALMTVACGGSASWNMAPTNRFPLTTALARTFGSDPRRVLAAVADRPPRPVSAQSGTQVPWTRARRTIAAVIPNELRRQMIDWGRTAAPGTSWFSLLVSMLLRSTEVAGMRVSPQVAIVMDLRRFLGSAGLDGNFVIGVPFAISYQTPPQTIGAMIRSAVTSGRPVAAQAATALRGWRGGVAPVSFDSTRLPRVTFSSVGTPPRMNSLSFRPGAPATISGSVEPEGPHGLTFLVSETPDTCVVTASFHENVIDPTLVAEALRLAQTEPLEILTKW